MIGVYGSSKPIHLDYPAERDCLSWEELRCLARSLGFPADVFETCAPYEYRNPNNRKGLTTKDLIHLVDIVECYNKALDRTLNIHTDEWNLNVLRRSLPLLQHKVFSFSDLLKIRVAFQTYEQQDTKGLKIDTNTLLRTIKMCGHMISPLKMKHRLKHMARHFEEKGRIQLHEFFDLLLWCDLYQSPNLTPKFNTMEKDNLKLYQIADYEEVLLHYDEQLHNKLDKEYLVEEWSFSKANDNPNSNALQKSNPPIDPLYRIKMVEKQKKHYKLLKEKIAQSNQSRLRASAGCVEWRPTTTQSLPTALDHNLGHQTSSKYPQSVKEIAGSIISSYSIPDIHHGVKRPEINTFQRPYTACLVSDKDLEKTHSTIEAVNFELSMSQVQHQNKFSQLFKSVLGSKKPVPTITLMDKTVDDIAPTFMKPQSPTTKLPHHKSFRYHHKCDARSSGFGEFGKASSHHLILDTPTFLKNPEATIHSKMHERQLKCTSTDPSNSPYLYRYTKNPRFTTFKIQ